MSAPTVLVSGSCGLIGSEVCIFFSQQGFRVIGIDSNHRAVFFGPEGDTSWVRGRLCREIPGYRHEAIDIRDRNALLALVKQVRPNLVIHTAAQPSHDRAAAIPFLDFEDVARFMYAFWKAPRVAEVYNLGGGRDNACSIMEAFRKVEDVTGRPMQWRYVDENRIGDHICYYSDLRKMRAHYPSWDITKSRDAIFSEIAVSWNERLARKAD